MRLRQMLLTALFAALLAVATLVAIPWGPVPFTLQIFVVLLSGVIIGSHYGALSVLLYILLGSIGLPVFAGGKAGLVVLIGPTGGFLLGFVVCAYVVGYGLERRPQLRLAGTILWMLLGVGITYLVGVTGFVLSFHYVLGKELSLGSALQYAVAPFIVLDIIKAIAAAVIGLRVRVALQNIDYIGMSGK